MKNFLFLFITLFVSFFSGAQFCNTATTNVTITPSTSVQYSATYTSGRRAFTFDAVVGNEYTFSTVGETTMDTYLRLYNSATGGTVLTESDDYNNTQSEITWYCSVSGTYSVFLTRWTASSPCNALNTTGARIKYQMGGTAGSTIVSIGYGEGLVYQAPVNHYYKYGWSEMIYLQSEINTIGSITKIRFQCDPGSPASYVAENQKIYMGHTTYSTFPNAAVKEDAQTNYVSSGYTLVYDGTITWVPGWVEIVLQTPFQWNNTDNLLIKWENTEGDWSSYYPMFYYTSATSTIGYYYQDASYPTVDGTRNNLRPNIKLSISPTELPVEMSVFNGIGKGDNNYLYWITATEHNTSHFNLQKSRDGENWTTISTLNASGNSTKETTYDITDFKVDPIINYYRLQQYDLDGIYETFGPITINNMDILAKKTIIKYVNLNGQEIEPEKITLLDVYIEIYDDGTMRKVIK